MNKQRTSILLGAAFLMATSAIGPGFLTQTTVFTQQHAAAFAFAILVSILLDIGAQLNIWRILTVSHSRAQDLANALLPGLGYFLALLVVLGGLVFNIANIGGCGLGLQALFGLDTLYGAILSGVMALFIFWMKEAGNAMDQFTRYLGILMVLLTLYVAVSSQPPVVDALRQMVWPDRIDTKSIITLVGGTVGGYISFAGAHRLLDAGIGGPAAIPQVNQSATKGILITGVMRILLFLAALGVVTKGVQLDSGNPAAAVFRSAAGEIGYRFFGMVMWSAAITSVVGAAYTSVSFLKTFHPLIAKNEKWFITFFIVCSTVIFAVLGNPVQLLIIAGALNGLILPVALAVMLLAAYNKRLVQGYSHPKILSLIGWIVVVIMSWLSILTLKQWLV
ncbi:NRAMP family divalent metal transporter [Chitinophaga sancti]|uniref:Mn2+ and Fe2+ transporters of the NRAMP family n=1 Tax=Chitinophaga sancti TaxID=1004 RepID=A0A1K1RBE9_9BACT|nr:NRAMP family divalent metal transporter [Chitinophaga sancti]WQD65561.1 NRAMP family divalent metal transporter [Chitinophaga sancti]WQG88816.1 NRAMP family divalent metal transporter [Chitinophaga sancti]SFW69249.1 Mn2+ and Fe2+ transporters of the NRAMP family [Chitinophaga sancti]